MGCKVSVEELFFWVDEYRLPYRQAGVSQSSPILFHIVLFLFYVILYFTILYYILLCYIILYYIIYAILYYIVLYYTILYYTILYYSRIYLNILQPHQALTFHRSRWSRQGIVTLTTSDIQAMPTNFVEEILMFLWSSDLFTQIDNVRGFRGLGFRVWLGSLGASVWSCQSTQRRTRKRLWSRLRPWQALKPY